MYIVIFYSQYVILSGLYRFDASTKALYIVQMSVILLCFIIIEVSFRCINRIFYKALLHVDRDEIKTMTLRKFYESEKTLALFNDYVVDLTSYAFEHPGGTFIIQQWNKKDIGKYIYGAYSMENSVSPHKHSFIAMKIIEKLIWARLVPDKKLDAYSITRRSSARYADYDSVRSSIKLDKKTSSYKIWEIDEFSKGLNRVVFKDTIILHLIKND